jgi:hypothetical protein
VSFLAANADLILGIVNAIFAVSMLPTVIHQFRVRSSSVPLISSLITFGGLALIAVVFYSLGLWYSAAAVAMTATTWGLIAVQRFTYGQAQEETPCYRCGIVLQSALCMHCFREEHIESTWLPHSVGTIPVPLDEDTGCTRCHCDSGCDCPNWEG